MIGGDTVVERNNGDTLRRQFQTATTSGPDALGIISWNEYSENSYIEPSRNYGTQYLDILTELLRENPATSPTPAMGPFEFAGEPGNGWEQLGTLQCSPSSSSAQPL